MHVEYRTGATSAIKSQLILRDYATPPIAAIKTFPPLADWQIILRPSNHILHTHATHVSPGTTLAPPTLHLLNGITAPD
jgi:hypothetical protein